MAIPIGIISLSIPNPSSLNLSSIRVSNPSPLHLAISHLSISTVDHLPPKNSTIRMGGGPRTFPGGVSKWEWKRMQAKKAKQLLKARLCRERQLYEMRKRGELQAAVTELERPWEVVERAPALFSVKADEQVKVLADRFQRAGGYDLWSERDGPQLFRSPADGLPSARFFPKGVVHSIRPYGRIAGDSGDVKELPSASSMSGSVIEDGFGNSNERRSSNWRGRGRSIGDGEGEGESWNLGMRTDRIAGISGDVKELPSGSVIEDGFGNSNERRSSNWRGRGRSFEDGEGESLNLGMRTNRIAGNSGDVKELSPSLSSGSVPGFGNSNERRSSNWRGRGRSFEDGEGESLNLGMRTNYPPYGRNAGNSGDVKEFPLSSGSVLEDGFGKSNERRSSNWRRQGRSFGDGEGESWNHGMRTIYTPYGRIAGNSGNVKELPSPSSSGSVPEFGNSDGKRSSNWRRRARSFGDGEGESWNHGMRTNYTPHGRIAGNSGNVKELTSPSSSGSVPEFGNSDGRRSSNWRRRGRSFGNGERESWNLGMRTNSPHSVSMDNVNEGQQLGVLNSNSRADDGMKGRRGLYDGGNRRGVVGRNPKGESDLGSGARGKRFGGSYDRKGSSGSRGRGYRDHRQRRGSEDSYGEQSGRVAGDGEESGRFPSVGRGRYKGNNRQFNGRRF